ncbi:ATP synthase subunit d, mitochondrial-like [Onthophagus taurus]|uniref:ATP synthase subunit d, mitochondrial-like n=1 Tax=Onthophagus taurus TaxID=166361 RepID=UPI000C20C22C|nr:ATP synthase subunit d, mitochondrial-like [Onthophagus taurus]
MAKRISQSSINWAALAERVPEHQKPQFIAFKSKADNYLRKVQQLPDAPPKLDWAFYKAKVPVPGMVAEFEKSYSALNIPFPADTVSGQLDSQEKEIKQDIEKFKTESNARIEEYKKQLAHLASLLPYDQMTLEDYRDAFPEDALDTLNKPTFWPHAPEDQLGYVDKTEAPSKH